MFNKNQGTEDSNFWISYADLMAGLLFVFILLIGAIVSKSTILKSDLMSKEEKLLKLSNSLDKKEYTLQELSDVLAKNEVLLDEKNNYLSENKKLIEKNKEDIDKKTTQINRDKLALAKNKEELKSKINQISKNKVTLTENERMMKLKIDEIDKLNKMLLESNEKKSILEDKVIVVQNMLVENNDKLKSTNNSIMKQKKTLDDYKSKVIILSSNLDKNRENIKIKDEKLLVLLNSIDESKTKYDSLIANMQSQKAKIKSLTGIKLKVVASLKRALGKNINIDKKSGSLRLSSKILFESGKSSLKKEAKDALKKAFEEYIGALISDINIKKHIDRIIIEGHTDSVGSYISNLKLSQDRALAVMEYLSTLEFTKKNNIKPLMLASGRAYMDKIVINGLEDKEASRRIEIKFNLKNRDAMIEIEKVLDAK